MANGLFLRIAAIAGIYFAWSGFGAGRLGAPGGGQLWLYDSGAGTAYHRETVRAAYGVRNRVSIATCVLMIVCILAPPRAIATVQRANTPLTFEVTAIRGEVALGTPIYLRFRLNNVGKNNVLANRRFYLDDTVLLQITGPSGVKLSWCGHIPQVVLSRGDFVILAPGAHVERTVRVSCDKSRSWGFVFDAPGQYVVKAQYELPFPMNVLKKAAAGALVVKGPIRARPIRIEVTSGAGAHPAARTPAVR